MRLHRDWYLANHGTRFPVWRFGNAQRGLYLVADASLQPEHPLQSDHCSEMLEGMRNPEQKVVAVGVLPYLTGKENRTRNDLR